MNRFFDIACACSTGHERPGWGINIYPRRQIDALFKEQGTSMSDEYATSAVELATELTIAWLDNPNNRVDADQVPAFLQKMHAIVTELAQASSAPQAQEENPALEYTPAVTARKSLASKDHIISMIDGKPYKTLRRHLSGHGLTPEQYRERYNLKADYPMVAENYSAARREMAHKIGLGQKGRAAKAAAPVTKPKRGPGRPKAA